MSDEVKNGMRNIFISSIVFSTIGGCATLTMADSSAWVSGQIAETSRTKACLLRIVDRGGEVRSSRPIDQTFRVKMPISPGRDRYSFEVACGNRIFRSSMFELNASSSIDLGTIILK